MQEIRVFGASPRSYRTIFDFFTVDGNNIRSALDKFGDDMSHDVREGGRPRAQGRRADAPIHGIIALPLKPASDESRAERVR